MSSRKIWLLSLIGTLIFNALVAAVIVVVSDDDLNYEMSWKISNVIGLSILLWSFLLDHFFDQYQGWRLRFLSLLLGLIQSLILIKLLVVPSLDILPIGLYGVIFGMIAVLGFGIYFETQRHRLMIKEAELKRMEAQIEPHFLFNTLANIEAALDTDPATAKQLIHALSKLLRQHLERAKSLKHQVTLRQEIELIKAYLVLQSFRLGERLKVHWRIDLTDKTLDKPFPPMVLQILIENAIVHGIEPALTGGEIWIQIHQQNHSLQINIQNSGQLLQKPPQLGLGLKNLQERLFLTFGDNATFQIETNSGRTQATIKVTTQRPS